MNRLKDSPLWEYAEQRFNELPLKEQVRRLADVIYTGRDNSDLTTEQQLDILMKSTGIDLISKHLTPRQLEVWKLANLGLAYVRISEELGYANRSSISQIMKSIKEKIMELLEEE